MKRISILLAVFVASAGFFATAASAESAMPNMNANSAVTPGTDAQESSGEVKKIDKETGKITIKHGPLQNLGMPAMTMVFRVKEPGMLDKVKEGDKIHFVAEKVNGALTVIKLEPAN